MGGASGKAGARSEDGQKAPDVGSYEPASVGPVRAEWSHRGDPNDEDWHDGLESGTLAPGDAGGSDGGGGGAVRAQGAHGDPTDLSPKTRAASDGLVAPHDREGSIGTLHLGTPSGDASASTALLPAPAAAAPAQSLGDMLARVPLGSTLLSWRRLLASRPEMRAVSLVYLVQGLLGVSRVAEFLFLKDSVGLEPDAAAAVRGASKLPWMIKPLYGFLSDAVPVMGYRRKSYLVLSGLLAAASWGALAAVPPVTALAFALLTLGNLGTAFSDVVADSLVVEATHGAPASLGASLQSLCWAWQSSGKVAAAAVAGPAVDLLGSRGTFLATALCPGLVALAALSVRERRVGRGRGSHTGFEGGRGVRLPAAARGEGAGASVGAPRSAAPSDEEDDHGAGAGSERAALLAEDGSTGRPASTPRGTGARVSTVPPGSSPAPLPSLASLLWVQLTALWSALRHPRILRPLIFSFLWNATPVADSAMLYYETEVLGFSPRFLGTLQLVGALASLAGTALFDAALHRTTLRKVFVWSAVGCSLCTLTQLLLVTGASRRLGIPDKLFAVVDGAVVQTIAQVAFMPVLVLAARLCPEGVEASLFACIMSVMNAGTAVGESTGAALMSILGITKEDFSRLPLLIAICGIGWLLPLVLLPVLLSPVSGADDEPEAPPGADADAKAGVPPARGHRPGRAPSRSEHVELTALRG